MSIEAPWTDEQVDNLNRFQNFGLLHPFTCPGHDGDADRTLVATRAGWVCPGCDYKQFWAHEFMCLFDAERAERAREAQPFISRM